MQVKLKVILVDQIPILVKEKMEKELISYEISHGIDINYKCFSLLLEENDQVIRLLNGYSAFTEIYIDDMWIEEDKSGCSFGTKLLHEVDKIFCSQGFNNINLVTNKFRAPKFYEKCGFTSKFIRKNPELNKYFYVKYFNDKRQSLGIVC